MAGPISIRNIGLQPAYKVSTLELSIFIGQNRGPFNRAPRHCKTTYRLVITHGRYNTTFASDIQGSGFFIRYLLYSGRRRENSLGRCTFSPPSAPSLGSSLARLRPQLLPRRVPSATHERARRRMDRPRTARPSSHHVYDDIITQLNAP